MQAMNKYKSMQHDLGLEALNNFINQIAIQAGIEYVTFYRRYFQMRFHDKNPLMSFLNCPIKTRQH